MAIKIGIGPAKEALSISRNLVPDIEQKRAAAIDFGRALELMIRHEATAVDVVEEAEPGDEQIVGTISFDGGFLKQIGIPAEPLMRAAMVQTNLSILSLGAQEQAVKAGTKAIQIVVTTGDLQVASRRLARTRAIAQSARHRLGQEAKELATDERRLLLDPSALSDGLGPIQILQRKTLELEARIHSLDDFGQRAKTHFGRVEQKAEKILPGILLVAAEVSGLAQGGVVSEFIEVNSVQPTGEVITENVLSPFDKLTIAALHHLVFTG